MHGSFSKASDLSFPLYDWTRSFQELAGVRLYKDRVRFIRESSFYRGQSCLY
jgi:hypothetical protein